MSQRLIDAGLQRQAVAGGHVWRINAARFTGDARRANGWFYLPEAFALAMLDAGGFAFADEVFDEISPGLTVLVTSSTGMSWDVTVSDKGLTAAFSQLAGISVSAGDGAPASTRVFVLLNGAIVAQASIDGDSAEHVAIVLDAAHLLAQRAMDEVAISALPADARDAVAAYRSRR